MPNYFRPSLKTQPELGVKEQFLAIDVELCKMLGVDVHPDYWVNQWVDTIGFQFAIGRDAETIKQAYAPNGDWFENEQHSAQQVAIVDWLVEHCDIDCYAQR